MTSASIPVGTRFPGAPNRLGRVALVIAAVEVAVVGAQAIAQPLIAATATSLEQAQSTMGIVAVLQTAAIALALAALIVGIIACRRPGLSKVAACIAIGVGGSTIVSYLFALLGMIVSMLSRTGG